jgi:hypothetical protein
MQSTKPVPDELLTLVRQAAPPEAHIVPLEWAYETEDYNIALVMPDTLTPEAAHQLQDHMIDAVMDWDAAHGTYTLIMVWREPEKASAGMR